MPAGLISGTINKDDPFKAIQGYEADIGTLDPATQTVQGQLSGLIAKQSPLMQGARTRAAQVANTRGLLNSSMAVQAGEEAAYGAALPIASADAAAYNQQAALNQAARNRASEFTATGLNTAAMQERAGQQDIAGQQLRGEQQLGLQRLSGEQALAQQELRGTQETALTAQRGQLEQGLQQLRGTQARDLAEIEASYRTLMQTSDSAGKLYQQSIDALNKTLLNPDLDAATKQAFVNQQVELLRSGLNVIGKMSDLDLPALLDFTAVTLPGSTAAAATTASPTAAAPAPAPGPTEPIPPSLLVDPETGEPVSRPRARARDRD